MIDELRGKKVIIHVAFNGKHIKGVIKTCSTLGGESFIIFDDGAMINTKYIQTI